MVSIRENTFETNSSSCHSIVICKSELRHRLESCECIYIGDFEYQDDYDLYINEINENTILTKENVISILNDFVNDNDNEHIYSAWLKERQAFVKTLDYKNMSLYQIMHSKDIPMYDILDMYGYTYTSAGTIFGGKDSDTSVYKDNEFLDKNTKEPISILVTQINC